MMVLADLWKLWTWKTSGTLKKNPQNGETAWPGRLTNTIFSPPFAHRRCQTLRLKPP